MQNIKHLILIITLLIMAQQVQSQQFPVIKAETLSQEKIVFPEITKGKTALILIAFKRQTQGQVDSWLDPFIEEFGDNELVTFYEIPMISNSWKWMSSWIDSGMRAGVPAYKHDHVATYYGPLSEYFEYFDVQDKRLCYVFLLDENGKIIWRNQDAATRESYNELSQLVREKIKKKG